MRGLLRQIWNTKGLARWILLVGAIVTVIFVLFAIFAPWIAPFDFNQTRDAGGVKFEKLASAGGGHLLGTNDQFYDIFSRVVWGARTAIEVVLLSVVISVVIGVPLGLVSGFLGGWVDRVLVFVMDAIYTVPYLLLAIIFAFMLNDKIGSGIVAAALSLVAIYIPQYFRVVRNTTLSAKEATYIEAARAIGARDSRIMRKYLFGNVVHSVPVLGTLNAADAILTLAGLGFLGLGIQSTDAAEWGHDLNRALADAGSGVWWTGLYPGLAIVFLVIGLTLVGEGLNETLNPTLRRRRLLPVVMPPRDQATPVQEEQS
jgi:peptide/nickel transport system permease protein